MKLTKLQKEAIRVLKTTKRRQTKCSLCNVVGGVSSYCALGIIGKCVLKMKNKDLMLGTADIYAKIQNKLGLSMKGSRKIASLNDNSRQSFYQIGEYLEEFPELFFTKGKK